MSRELQLQLKVGDQIIATDIAFYDYSAEIRAQRKQSQWVGDIMMVNNPRVSRGKDGEILAIADIVSGNGLNREPRAPGERPSLGLGTSLNVGTFRMATPDDHGFVATREQWWAIKDAGTRKMRVESFIYGVIAILSLGYLAFVVMP